MNEVSNEQLWPGPITFVLRKNSGVPNVTTGGSDTVAVNSPSRELLRLSGSGCSDCGTEC